MKNLAILSFAILAVALVFAGCLGGGGSPTATPSVAPTISSTETPPAPPSASPAPTGTPTVTLSPSTAPNDCSNCGKYGYVCPYYCPSPSPTAAPTAYASSTPAPTISVTPTATASASSGPSPVTFQVTAKEYIFSPSVLTVSRGQQVTVVFFNDGVAGHTFTIPDLGVDTGVVSPGAQKTVTFTAPSTAGSHGFLCTVPGHSSQGMTGTFTVD